MGRKYRAARDDGVSPDQPAPERAHVPGTAAQTIYCGDNLDKLRTLPDACVDLIYIDPPFNSNRNYEVFWGATKEKRAFEDRHASSLAYIEFLQPRCVELHRVLKPNGSFYFHCDWHASHYVKAMLDRVFGDNQFQSEIVWKRTSSHGNVSIGFGNITDSIFYYGKGGQLVWNQLYLPYSDAHVSKKFTGVDPYGRRFTSSDLRNPGHRPNLHYVYKASNGVSYEPHPNGWAVGLEVMQRYDREGLLYFPKKAGGRLRLKRYLDETKGERIQNLWTDIAPVNSRALERRGYPTQKPLALLDRIIKASSNPGGIVLDSFCGCGTALVAAQNLGRKWIGIDISPTACRVMATRLKSVCKLIEGRDFYVRDLPKTAERLRKYPPFEFENWAVTALSTVLVNGQAIANRAKVGDMGIDGRVYPIGAGKEKKSGSDMIGDIDTWLPLQVKQKDKAGRPDIDRFETAMRRQGRVKGFFISFDFTSDAKKEVERVGREPDGMEIILVTVDEILAEEVRYRL